MTDTSQEVAAAPAARARPAWVKPAVVVLVVLVCGWLASTFLGTIDWAAVGTALARLTVLQLVVLLGVLLVRQTLNALPLALFIEGLGAGRALLNDLVAALAAVIAPPPGDMVVRIAMFRAWGIEASRGLAGATMNMVAFYVNRFAAPLVGVAVLVGAGSGTDRTWTAAASGLVALTIAVLVSLMVRQDRFAARLGKRAGTVARRFRSSVDPETWATAATEFTGHVSGGYRRAFPRSLLVLSAMVLSDACVLLLALRFVGVSGAEVPAYEVIGIFFLAYPLTLTPLMGLGIYDVALLAAFMEVGGDALEPELVAALTVWRAVTLVGPVLLGTVATATWKRLPPRAASSSRTRPWPAVRRRVRVDPADVVDLFVYVVVLNLAVELVPSVLSESFTVSLVTAALLKLTLELVLVVKGRVVAMLRPAATPRGRRAGWVLLVAVAAASNVVVLGLVDVVLGDAVSLGGFVPVTVLVLVLLASRKAVRRLLDGTDRWADR